MRNKTWSKVFNALGVTKARHGTRGGLRSRTALLGVVGLAALGACGAPNGEDAEDTGEAGQAVTGRDVGRAINNPNAQFTSRWFLNDTTAPANNAEFTSPITTPDGRLALTHISDTNFSLGVVVAPETTAPDYDASAGTVDSFFMDRMLVRNTDGSPKLTQLAAPSSGPVWSTNSTSEQMGLGADPRLAGGLAVRIGSTAADAIANCFRSDPSIVAVTPSGQYECRRYLLFMPGKDSSGTLNRVHVASFGVVLQAYDPADPFQRLAEPTIVAARFLSSFQPLKAETGTFLDTSIEPSITADSRLLMLHTGAAHFTFSETPWDPNSWEPRRSLTCLATPQGTTCPGTATVDCATTPGKCGIANKPICVAGRDTSGNCNAATMTFRDKYPIAAYPIRNPDGSLYMGLNSAKSIFGGSYGWISFDGSEFFFNVGSAGGGARAVRAVFGKSTRGVIKHIDNQSNVATGRYCISISGVANWHSIADGDTTDCQGTSDRSDGLRLTMPLGTGAGLWRFSPEQSEALLPFSRRGPLYMLVDHNQLLGNFGPAGSPAFNTAAGSAEHRYRHIYSEVALDDFADGDFVAYYHMNEMIAANSNRKQLFDSGKTPDTSGNFYTAVLGAGAQFPLQRAGGEDQAGMVNPGYIGRGIFFQQSGAARVPAGAGGPFAASMPAFTVELALKPLAAGLWAANTTTTLAEMPGFWKLLLVSNSNGDFYPQITIYKTDGTTSTFGTTPAAITKSTAQWTHVTMTLDLSASGDRRARFYVNGVLKQVTNALPANSRTQVPAGQTNLLILGPNGTGPAGDSYMLDEVAISRKVRDAEYIATAAFRAPTTSFNVANSTSLQGPYLFSDTGVLPTSMLGLSVDDLRIPQTLLNKIGTARALTNDTWRTRFNKIRDLGAALFNDDLLTVTWNTATSSYVESKDSRTCATCHVSGQGRAHQNVAFDTDIFGASLAINSPTALNRAFSRRHFFDNRSMDLVDQVLRPVENTASVEMGGDATDIASFISGKKPDGTSYAVLAGSLGTGAADGYPTAAPARPAGVTTYLDWFRYAFGSGPTDSVNVPSVDRTLVAHALAAFTLSLTAGNSNVDKVRAGLSASTIGITDATYASIVNGFRVFEGKGRCVACHSGSTYSDEMLHASATARDADGAPIPTKTPTLRRVSVTGPYFRDASMATLADVVNHYDTGGCTKTDSAAASPVTCDPELYPLGLTAQERTDLVTFLQNL